ncbi:Zinc finger, MYND-type [Cinara cedri]|uniref:Zinc finger, MYND-type n=1 Tax=Cinara cedri TaxID=506608 RepID=A0A5E4NEP0_9HEMI|nr:Zinc finger, MYND-type [Cinara cedri]
MSPDAREDTCAVCGGPAAQRCANCRAARYCGRAHQRAHWKDGHKAACHPYVVLTSPALGRHWVAARDIKAGEVLLEERPLVVGPKAGSPPVCLACYAPVTDGRTCSACGWPVCGARCEMAPVHRLAECPLIAGQYDARRSAVYCFVTPLRCMLLDSSEGDRRAAFRSLQSHLDRRIGTPLYQAYAINVAAFVLDRLGLRRLADSDGGPHDERSALEATAVLDTNAFEVRREGGRKFRAVYSQASMMAHSCTPNTKHVFVGDPADGCPVIRITAAVAIGLGCPVTATYTQTLWCTRDRLRHLQSAKCFECACPRCTDPTELGTHLGSIACRACATGRVPITADGPWQCTGCGRRTDDSGGDGVAEAEHHVRSLSRADGAGFERFVKQVYASEWLPLHAGHYVTVGAKYALAQLYSNRISELTPAQLKYNTKICEELLWLADVLEPGITRFRGLLLFYLVRGLKQLNRVTKTKQNNYETIKNYTEEAVVILKTEPDLVHLIEQLQ